jgi:uncharacterized protein YaiI (UPF0178 family)
LHRIKVLVDADACPVKDIIISIAKEFELEIVMFADTSHILDDGYSRVVIVSQARDAVDIALINQTQQGDIVVTQDYGVASMALGKQAYAINHNGLIYDSSNIDRLLMERFLSQKIRRPGGRTSNQKKRSTKDNLKFEKAFRKLCIDALESGICIPKE